MKRILIAALAGVLTCAASVRADDKQEDKPKTRQERLQELRQETQKMMQEVITAFRAAKSQEDKDKAIAKLDPIREKGYKLIDENPKDDVSFNTLQFLMGTAPTPPEKVLDLFAKNFVDDDKLAPLIMQVAGNAGAAKLLTAAEKSSNKTVKAAGIIGKANQKVEAIDEAKGADADKLTKEAEELLVKAVKEFGDTKLLGSTVETMANKALYFVRNLTVGKTAPETVGHNIDGKDNQLSDYRGKVVVLDIWATWCGPCRAMIPHEREMVERLKDKPFALISISADQDKKTLEKFLEKEKMPWTHWWEGPGDSSIVGKWNVRFFPTIYVLDSKGVIRHKNIRGEELEKAVTTLIEEAAKK